jgi:cytochrome c peroxidase
MRVTPLRVAAALAAATLATAFVFVSTTAVGAQGAPTATAPQTLGRHVPLGLDIYMPVPGTNPLTTAKAALGRRLFFDPILSDDGALSCAGCHDPEQAFTDGKALAEGVGGRRGTRNAPTLINRGYGEAFFLDGRAASLEEQVLQPLQGANELATRVDTAVERLREDDDYRRAFGRAFGREPDADALAAALASYVRTIVSGNAPVDRYALGDSDALSALECEGQRIFHDRGRCSACHGGPNFSDEQFHNTGGAWRPAAGASNTGPLDAPRDEGRFAMTGEPRDRGAFKTPTLREVARTAPYMHDGSLATLEDVVDFYDGGGQANPHLDPEIRPLGLSDEEKAALVSFLRALTGEVTDGR